MVERESLKVVVALCVVVVSDGNAIKLFCGWARFPVCRRRYKIYGQTWRARSRWIFFAPKGAQLVTKSDRLVTTRTI